jgi:acyl transferase domain-containing protein
MLPAGFHDTPLAIVGMACRFPGGETLDDFWSLLREGRSAFTPLGPERFDPSLHFSETRGAFSKSYCRILGQVEQRPVDPRILDIPTSVAERYDVTHLTLAEVAASACRHAGYDPKRLPYRNTGVYLGNSSVGDLEGDFTYSLHARQLAERLRRIPEFASLPADLQGRLIEETADAVRRSCPAGTHSKARSFAASTASGLIASLFGTNGPALVTDAACAASFTALHLAARALHLGSIDMAIVGAGACRSWAELTFLSLVQAMSGTGSRPFDADADGLIAADGYGAVIVKTLPRALADGDRIVAVIRGVGISTDGRGKGFWAPLPEGQMESMRRALGGNIDPATLQYIHCHATSTQLGDATEMQSIAGVYGSVLKSKIPVTSVKANIGHTLETAGMAGLIATLLAMEHQTIPPAANLKTLNPEIPWDSIPFFAPTSALPWTSPEAGGPRRAAVNAFGIGGLNTNIILDDAPDFAAVRFAPSAGALNARTQGAALSTLGAASIRDQKSSFAQSPTDAIAVIGVGCVLPGAFHVGAFLDLLNSDVDPKSSVPPERWDASLPTPGLESHTTPLRGGFLSGYQFDWKKHRIPPFQVANSNPLQFLLLDAADQAFQDSGYAAKPLDRQRVGTLVGAVFTNDFCADVHLGVRIPEFQRSLKQTLTAAGMRDESIQAIAADFESQFLKEKPGALDETGAYSSSTLASRVAKQLDFGGGAFSIDAGDVSGLAAVSAAADLLRTHQCDLMMCCSGQRNVDAVRFAQLARQGLLNDPSTGGAGIVPGEGAVAFLLKRYEDAVRDGDEIRAVLHAAEQSSDTNRLESAVGRAMAGALGDSSMECAGTKYVAFPTTGDAATDDRLRQALRGAPSPQSTIDVGELTHRFGHLQGAAAMVDLLAAVVRCSGSASAQRGTGTEVVGGTSTGGFVDALGGLASVVRVAPHQPWTDFAGESTASEFVSADASADIERFALNLAIEWSGVPEGDELLDADLEHDLRLSLVQRVSLVEHVAVALSGESTCGAPVESIHTLRDLIHALNGGEAGIA